MLADSMAGDHQRPAMPEADLKKFIKDRKEKEIAEPKHISKSPSSSKQSRQRR